MNIDAVKASSSSAYQHYIKGEYSKFIDNMDKFYKAGKSNPALADIILGDTIKQGIVQAFEDNEISNKKLLQIPRPNYLIASLARNNVEIDALTQNILSIKRAIKGQGMIKDMGLYFLKSKHEFDNVFNKNYPKTRNIRKAYTENGFISFDKTNPKPSWIQKISLGNINEYKKLYPKTLYLRVRNIVYERIVENNVTPKLKTLPRLKTKFELIRKGIKL